MPVMFGFGEQRRQMLEAELKRFIDEMPQLGMEVMYLVGPFARGTVDPGTVLDLVLIQETELLPHRRSDFWTTHLRPRVGANFFVFTRNEFENPHAPDPLIRDARDDGERVYG